MFSLGAMESKGDDVNGAVIQPQRSPPARATQTQRELVRILVLEHGHQKASELSGVNYDTVRQWASRGKWKSSQSVTNPVQAVAQRITDDLSEHERETRLSLAKASRRMAKDCEELPVKHAKLAHTVAQTAAITHGWDAKKDKDQANIAVNIAILNA